MGLESDDGNKLGVAKVSFIQYSDSVWKYLKAAFLFGVTVPALGKVPMNALVAVGFAILGFGHPAFWLLGAGLEASFVFALASNSRFQRLVNSRQSQLAEGNTADQRQALINLLSPEAKARLSKLTNQCDKVLQVYAGTQAYDYIVTTNHD